MTVSELNGLNRAAFVIEIGWVFEDSSWVAERAWSARPFADIEQLHTAMVRELERASYVEQLALLRAHPDLGARAKLSNASASEQAGVGLDQLTPGEFQRITALNERYRQKFSFPFLFAVKKSTKYQILDALQRRLSSETAAEFAEALQQVYRIAEFRLHDVLEA